MCGREEMLHMILRGMLRAKSDEKGIVLILTALLIVPFVVLLGVAVDVGRLLVVKNQLTTVVDAAAIALAKSPSLTDATAEQALVNAFRDADFPSQTGITFTDPVVTRPDKLTVNVTVTATISTDFVKVIGYNTLSTTVYSQAVAAQNYMEVVLVLDNTTSMSDPASKGDKTSKIQALITAANNLTNIVFSDLKADGTSQYVKVGVVPFTTAVNVGTGYAAASWMDTGGKGALTRENLDVQTGQSLFDLFNTLKSNSSSGYQSRASWKGCVRQRNEPYDIQEDTPVAAAGKWDTLFTPLFTPDTPDDSGFVNSYLEDGSFSKGTTSQTIQRSVTKYTTAKWRQNLGAADGPNRYCPDKSILRLTNVKQSVVNEISGMTANGNTVLAPGLIWGWHLLSPIGPFGDGVPYSDAKTIKAIVLVTDGMNNVSGGTNGFNKSVYNAYGFAGSTPSHLDSASPETTLDTKFSNLCTNIKALKDASGNPRIVIYTIGLGAPGDFNGDLLQKCATDSSNYYTAATAAALNTAFQNIALGLNKLRLSK
jgi:Flp pilus assembly protein TadG